MHLVNMAAVAGFQADKETVIFLGMTLDRRFGQLAQVAVGAVQALLAVSCVGIVRGP